MIPPTCRDVLMPFICQNAFSPCILIEDAGIPPQTPPFMKCFSHEPPHNTICNIISFICRVMVERPAVPIVPCLSDFALLLYFIYRPSSLSSGDLHQAHTSMNPLIAGVASIDPPLKASLCATQPAAPVAILPLPRVVPSSEILMSRVTWPIKLHSSITCPVTPQMTSSPQTKTHTLTEAPSSYSSSLACF